MRKHAAAVVGAALLASLLAACSDGGAEAETGEEGSDGLREVAVGVMSVVDTAPIWLGVEEGIFEEHGLELDLQVMAGGGTATVPGIMSGDLDFGFGNSASLVNAYSRGMVLPIVASADSSTGVDGEDASAILVPVDSDIDDPADLEGRTVAVNAMGTIGDTTVRETVDNAGGDGASIEFVEIAFPEMGAALENGQVDAAWVVEPFVTINTLGGARQLSSNYVATHPDFLIAAYFTSTGLVDEDPELVRSFAAAMQESQAFAANNEDRVREILPTYMELDEELAAQVTLPRFNERVTPEEIEFLVEFADRQGLTEEPVPADSVRLDAQDL